MIRNSNSKGCTVGCLFDKYVKEHYFPAYGTHHVTLLRGALSDKDIRAEFIEALALSEDSSIQSWEKMEEHIDSINTTLSEGKTLSNEQEKVIREYAEKLTKFLQESNLRDRVKERVNSMAGNKSTKAQAYRAFRTAIPAQYRREVLTQLVSGVIKGLDVLEASPAFKNFTRQEILNYTGANGPVIEKILNRVRRKLREKYEQLINDGTITEDQKKIFEALLGNGEGGEQTQSAAQTWASAVDMAKDLLLEAEHLKLDTYYNYTFDTDEEDLETPNPEDEAPQSAEEVGAEHWQLKSDTISSFNSMAREVRSLLYKLSDGKVGILGITSIVDAMLVHQNLLSLRADKYCTNSNEFIQVLKDTNLPWSTTLAAILEADPYKRSLVFTTYKKNHLYYVYHNKEKTFIREKGLVTMFYRNKSGLDAQVLLNHYVGGVVDINPGNNDCIFDSKGIIDPIKFQAFKNNLFAEIDGVPFYDEQAGLYRAEYYGLGSRDIESLTPQEVAENKRAFIRYVNGALNLHLNHEDVEILTSNQKDFKTFCYNLHGVLTLMFKKEKRLRTIESVLSDAIDRKFFKRLLKSSVHTLSIQDRVSPIEPTFRYNKGSYVAHTIPNAIGDTLEKLGKAAAQGKEALRDYLEKTYLECPVYATKTTVEGETTYTIHNEWLARLYNVSEEDLKNPASWANQFINNLTRGLGTKDREFEDFTEKDNCIFTLNEYMQTYSESRGQLGVVPLFITGDSNATRYLTTPILSDQDIIDGMVNVALQEIERMKMFQGILDWCDSKGYKISNGHQGSVKGDPFYNNNPLVKNANKFTFLTFLNEVELDGYESWQDAYAKIKATDPSLSALKELLRSNIVEALDAKYAKFERDLLISKIATKAGGNTVVNKETLYVPHSFSENGFEGDRTFLKNFYLNTKFNLIQQLQMLTVDPGFYNGTEDMQKRFKELIASGEVLDKTAIDPTTGDYVDNNHGHQRVWYFDEIIRDSNKQDPTFIQILEGIGTGASTISRYSKNTLTDGQGYRSFTSYRKIMIMRGLWTKEAETVYQIIIKNREAGNKRLSIEQLKEIDRLGVVFQPLKPFYYGFERLETSKGVALIPVQHKYSEFPIIPELLPANSKLGQLGIAMEAENIDLATCTTTVKVGGFGSFNIDNCNTADEIREVASRTGYVHNLDLDGWRQQSNVPEHTDTSRARGTQWVKHGYGCLADSRPKAYKFLQKFKDGFIRLTRNNKIYLNDGHIDQLGMVKLYGALGSVGFIKSALALVDRLSSPESCSEALSQMRANDSRGSNDSLDAYELDENGEFILSPSEGLTAADNMASLLSTLRKEVVKQRMKGGSCVQVSAYGMDDILKVHTDESKSNIIYADCARTFDYSVTTHDGTLIKLDYFEFVDPETGMLLDDKGKPVEPAEADKDHEYYGWNTKMGKLYPGILDMIAYRIPTEKDYSILNLKVKRFFPKTTGGIMMVPSQFTTIAGFDFKQYWSH